MNAYQEDLTAKILRIYYTKLWPTSYDREQLQLVLGQQFAESSYGEVGGSIFQNERGLELRMVKPKETQVLENALNQYVQRDFSAIELLIEAAQKRLKLGQQEKGSDPLVLRAIGLLIETLTDQSLRTKSDNIEHIKNFYPAFILNTQYPLSFNELGMSDKKFRGTFHVHPSGGPPTLNDQLISQRYSLPGLVLAAKKTFPETGIAIYLVHSGLAEQLYQGPLPSEEHINL